jgi:radical SAM enzyme (TIGR01210 family)
MFQWKGETIMPPRLSVDPEKPISVWKERDSINGEAADVLVMILNGPGCSWYKKVGCTMCGYNVECGDPDEVTVENFVSQTIYALKKYTNEPYIKIFTSGSFLDPDEIPQAAQEAIFKEISRLDLEVRLLIESRPEYVQKHRLIRLMEFVKDIEIAIGLESRSDTIRAENIRKGFTWEDYLIAGRTIIDLDLKLKTYLLLKPPFLGEADSIKDAVDSISEIASEFPDSRISINPMNIQTGTEVDVLYKRRLYRPPWLWSLIEVMKRGYESSNGSIHLMSSPTAGGRMRGAHNCGKCDTEILKNIEKFSISNKIDLLDGLHHGCRVQWEEYLIESISSPKM